MSSLQKRLAARILKVGESRVWLDPSKTKDIDAAITKIDIRKLIKQGAIKALPKKVHKPREKKRRGGPGRKRGSMFAKFAEKERWISTVRPLRKMLRELRGEEVARSLAQKGIITRAASWKVMAEEAPEAYKDVTRVVDIAQGAGLSRKVAKVVPVGVLKG